MTPMIPKIQARNLTYSGTHMGAIVRTYEGVEEALVGQDGNKSPARLRACLRSALLHPPRHATVLDIPTIHYYAVELAAQELAPSLRAEHNGEAWVWPGRALTKVREVANTILAAAIEEHLNPKTP